MATAGIAGGDGVGRVSAWLALKTAVKRYPILGLLVALVVPLLGASAIFLAPFAVPLGIAALVFSKSGPKAEVRSRLMP
jgi:hypothetical protein